MDVPQLEARVVHGDCLSVLPTLEDESVDLIFTSPPYADSRSRTYGGIHPDQYVDWFLPISKELHRVLKPTGTFVLNIKERVVAGQRHTYVLELILALKAQGWLWTEEFIWHKKNCHPGKWPNRFRDAWERLLQFNKQRHFAMYQDAVMVPMGDWAKTRLRNLSETDRRRDDSRVGSGFGKNVSAWVGRELAYPSNVLHVNSGSNIVDMSETIRMVDPDDVSESNTNVLHLATETGTKNHSAVFPEALPEWFIKLFTAPGDCVLDPFAGSGTTIAVAQRLGRNAVGIEIMEEYCKIARGKINQPQFFLQSADL